MERISGKECWGNEMETEGRQNKRSSGEDFVCPATESLRGHPMPLYPVCLQIKVKDMQLHKAHSVSDNCPFTFARTVKKIRL